MVMAEMATRLPVRMRVNGIEYAAEVEPRLLLVHFLRDNLGLTGTHVGCDTSQCGACVVYLNGAGGQELHRAGRPGRRRRDHDDRGAGQGRPAPPGPGGLLGDARPAVRLLHAGHDHVGLRPAQAQPQPERGRDPPRAWRATSAAAPATRTSSAPSSTPPSRWAATAHDPAAVADWKRRARREGDVASGSRQTAGGSRSVAAPTVGPSIPTQPSTDVTADCRLRDARLAEGGSHGRDCPGEDGRPADQAARRPAADHRRAATTSTTSSCRACSTPRSCAALRPRPDQEHRHQPRRRRMPGVVAVFTGEDLMDVNPLPCAWQAGGGHRTTSTRRACWRSARSIRSATAVAVVVAEDRSSGRRRARPDRGRLRAAAGRRRRQEGDRARRAAAARERAEQHRHASGPAARRGRRSTPRWRRPRCVVSQQHRSTSG